MGNYECLADGHHVDDAGNLIACTYVDFRDPAERFPITTLQKASSKRRAISGCATIRISKPTCFLDQGEGLNDGGESHHGTNGWIHCASIEPVVRFLCATFGCGVAAVQVSEDGFIVAAAEVAGDGLVDVSITVGPDGTRACRVSAGGAHTAATAADGRSFETVLTERLARVG